MKVAFLAVFGCFLVASAHGSYDLLMVPDEVSKGIARLDPGTQVYMGAFARNDPNRVIHSVNKAAIEGQVFATGGTSAFWDYNSGYVLGNTGIPSGTTIGNSAGTRFTEAFGSTVYYYNSLGTYSGGIATGLTGGIYAAAPLLTTSAVAFGADGSGNFAAFARTSSLSVTTSFATPISSLLLGTPLVTSESSSQCIVSLPMKRADGINVLARYFVDMTSGVVTASSSNILYGFSNTACLTILPSHYGYYIIGRDATTASLTRITNYSLNLSTNYSFTTSAIQVPTSRWVGAIVLAPEPASYAVFLVGGFALLRRRRR